VLAGEHAPKFESGDLLLEPLEIAGHGRHGLLVVLLARHLEQIPGIAEPGIERLDDLDRVGERGALLTELLCPLRLAPDGGVLELPQDLLEPLLLAFVVKGTP